MVKSGSVMMWLHSKGQTLNIHQKCRSVYGCSLTSGGLWSHENHEGRTLVLPNGTKVPTPEIRWRVCWTEVQAPCGAYELRKLRRQELNPKLILLARLDDCIAFLFPFVYNNF